VDVTAVSRPLAEGRHGWRLPQQHRCPVQQTGDQCYDFVNIFSEKIGEKIGGFGSKYTFFNKNDKFSPKIGKNRRNN
jgi:hypothetical protein